MSIEQNFSYKCPGCHKPFTFMEFHLLVCSKARAKGLKPKLPSLNTVAGAPSGK